jgi:hypothetical protein
MSLLDMIEKSEENIYLKKRLITLLKAAGTQ